MIKKPRSSSCSWSMSLDLMALMLAPWTSLGGSSPIRRSTGRTSMRRVSVEDSLRQAESENQNGVLRRASALANNEFSPTFCRVFPPAILHLSCLSMCRHAGSTCRSAPGCGRDDCWGYHGTVVVRSAFSQLAAGDISEGTPLRSCTCWRSLAWVFTCFWSAPNSK